MMQELSLASQTKILKKTNSLCCQILQVPKEFSSTGFIRVVGEDLSPPHPCRAHSRWNYIVREYNPTRPDWYGGKVTYLMKDELMSIIDRNEVRVEISRELLTQEL